MMKKRRWLITAAVAAGLLMTGFIAGALIFSAKNGVQMETVTHAVSAPRAYDLPIVHVKPL